MENREVQKSPHSKAWVIQTWIAFSASGGMMLWFIYVAPIPIQLKLFMSLSFAFVVSSTLTLSKTLRDVHEHGEDDLTWMWKTQVWVSFIVSVAGFGWALWVQPFDDTTRVLLYGVLLFSMSASAGIAKTARDIQVAE